MIKKIKACYKINCFPSVYYAFGVTLYYNNFL
nr:MAG TPA: hypothetical protein [Caudoviricetes sp.]